MECDRRGLIAISITDSVYSYINLEFDEMHPFPVYNIVLFEIKSWTA